LQTIGDTAMKKRTAAKRSTTVKRTIEIDLPDKLNAYIESLAKFLKTNPETIIRRTVADAVKSIPDNTDKHIDPAQLKKVYKLK